MSLDTTSIIKKVRKIEIKTKGMSNNLFAGEYHSAFKGKGMSFSEVRNYQYGDDIKNIDWNVTARSGHPHVKVFEEERELTVMLLVDASGSSFFGTSNQFKYELITEICAVIAFTAMNNNDKVGIIIFTDKIEKFIPPLKGKKHVLRIIRELVNLDTTSSKTSLNTGLEYFNKLIKKKSVCFLMSDFVDTNYETALRLAGQKHDLIGLHIYDKIEKDMPNVGLIRAKDPETGEVIFVNSGSEKTREKIARFFDNKVNSMQNAFKAANSDFLNIHNETNYSKELLNFFKRRRVK
jgi:uncharacterized protein (DUF58 family)